MYLKRLKLINFRNYRDQEVNFSPYFNFLVGNNAQGKTNVIEAIYYLSTGKSYRTQVDRELVRWNNNTLYLRGDIEEELKSEKSIEVGISGINKKVRVNGIEIKKRGELLGNLSAVIFSPEELKLVKEGPGFRRKFMDQEIVQMKPTYYYALNSYNKVLMQRNTLLKEIIYKKELKDSLSVWDKQLAYYGSKVIYDRVQFVKKLSILARLMHRRITSGGEELEVSYCSCIDFDNEMSRQEIEEEINKNLMSTRGKDIKTGVTSFGPHREDLSVEINGIDVRKYGSQGQQRTAALSMKLSELELIKGETGKYPVLLLDDVMSELDPLRQEYIMNNLEHVQVFITCTRLTEVMKKRCKQGKVFEVNGGIITTGSNST